MCQINHLKLKVFLKIYLFHNILFAVVAELVDARVLGTRIRVWEFKSPDRI